MQPELFEQSLKNYDAALSLRWGRHTKRWLVERAGNISEGELLLHRKVSQLLPKRLADPALSEPEKQRWREGTDAFESMQHGKRVVLYCPKLDNRIFDALYNHDLQVHGMGLVEKTRNRREAQKQKERSDGWNEIARESQSVFDWALRKRSAELMAGKVSQVLQEGFKDLYNKQPHKPAQRPTGNLLDAAGRPIRQAAGGLQGQIEKRLITTAR